MIWHLIRYLVSFSIPAFYKKIQGKNFHHLKVKGPVIIAMNHPNAFIDPICITWLSYPVRVKYLARGDAFKPGLASFLLTRIGIIPIFRLRDGGKEGLRKNDEAYRLVNKLLKKNAKIIIFAEGLCVQERRLRPLKKGVARMVFGAQEFLNSNDLVVVPVGVNYSNASHFGSKLFYNVGEPIKVSDFTPAYKENNARAQNQFLQLLDNKMRGLITHIKNKENDKLVVELEEMIMKDWLKKLNLSDHLENEFTVTNHLTEIINNTDELDPNKIADLRERTSAYFKLLQKNKLRDWLIDPLNKTKLTPFKLILRLVLIVLASPIYITGYIAAYLPYKASEKLTKKLVKRNKEFYASIAIGAGSFIFLFNFLLWFLIIYHYSPNVIWPLMLVAGLLTCSWFTLKLHFFILKTIGIMRIGKKPALYTDLAQKREKITDIINGLTNF